MTSLQKTKIDLMDKKEAISRPAKRCASDIASF
jgi:hypothetical protein